MDINQLNENLSDLLNSQNGCQFTDLNDDIFATGSVKKLQNINVLHLNMRSFLKNYDSLVMLLNDLQERGVIVHVIALCETFLNGLNMTTAKLENYKELHRCRENRLGGGISIFVHDRVKLIRVIDSPFNDNFESLLIEVSLNGNMFMLSEIYRPPNSDDTRFSEGLDEILTLVEKCKISFICGDFNYDLLKMHIHKPTEAFFGCLLDHNHAPYISKPTRVTYSSSTLIDNIFVKTPHLNKSLSYILIDGMSDHFPCFLSLELCAKRKSYPPVTFERRKITDDSLLKIQQDLLFHDWEILYDMSTDTSYEYLTSTITAVLDRHSPKKVIKIHADERFVEPWLTVSIKKCNQKCRKLCAKAKRTGLPTDHDTYVGYRNALRRVKVIEKRNYYHNLFQKIGKNAKLLWNVVNCLVRKTQNKSDITELLYDGKVVTGEQEICNTLNEHFVKAGLNVQTTIKNSNVSGVSLSAIPRINKQLKFRHVTESHICKIISNMKPKTSSGHDEISNNLLKNIISVINVPLCLIINKSLDSGIFPDLMKLAKVIPLHKGGESQIPDNYHPISLLPVFSKILEKVVYEQVVTHLELHNILYSKQFGFRKNHSTIDAITTLMGEILNGFEKNFMTLSIFIDLHKAFDTVSHSLLLKKLDLLGIRGCELTWFENYLSNRKQFVSTSSNCKSDLQTVSIGVPQGSLLGVLIFQLFINDIYRILRFCSCILYADDTTFYVVGKSLKFLRAKMNSDLCAVSSWLTSNKLKLNVSKTKCVLFNKEGLDPDPGISVNNEFVKSVSSFKFLGIILDLELNFESHYSALYNKLMSASYLIRSLSRTLPIECVRTLYFAYFHSHLTYGMNLWFPLISKMKQETLFKIQKRILRSIMRVGYRDHCMPLYKRLQILTLYDQLKFENLKQMYKLDRDLLPVPMKNMYVTNSTRGTRIPVPLCRLSKVNKSFLCQPIVEWNALQSVTKDKISLKSFLNCIKVKAFNSY